MTGPIFYFSILIIDSDRRQNSKVRPRSKFLKYHITSYYIILYHIILHQIILYHMKGLGSIVGFFFVVKCLQCFSIVEIASVSIADHIILYHFILYHIMSLYIISCHIISLHMSYYITSERKSALLRYFCPKQNIRDPKT